MRKSALINLIQKGKVIRVKGMPEITIQETPRGYLASFSKDDVEFGGHEAASPERALSSLWRDASLYYQAYERERKEEIMKIEREYRPKMETISKHMAKLKKLLGRDYY